MSAVGAQSSLSSPLSPSRKYPIHIEGKARVFTTYLPMDEVDKMNEPSSGQVAPRQVFMYAWVDKNNGASAHVSAPSDEDGGRFALKMDIKDGDSPALKLHVSVRTQDQETKNFRTFPLAVSCSDLETLLTGQEDSFCMEDQFMEGNFVSVSLRMVNADSYRNHPASSTDPSKPLIKFGATALDKISECNKIMARISNEIQQNIDTNKMVVAPGFSNFKSGLTSREFGGRKYSEDAKQQQGSRIHRALQQRETSASPLQKSRDIPMVQTHYAAMHAQEETLQRELPEALVLYHLHLKLVHSGETAESILGMNDARFGTLFAQALQFTCDPGLVPYQRDGTLRVVCRTQGTAALLPSPGHGLFRKVCKQSLVFKTEITGTENIACLSAPQMQGRTLRKLHPINVKQGSSMETLLGLFHQVTPSTASLIDSKTHFVEGHDYDSGKLTEMYTNILMDDCESSALLAKLAKKTCLGIYNRGRQRGLQARLGDRLNPLGQSLASACKGWPIFKNYTEKSWSLMADILARGGKMLADGHLQIMGTVGLASTASAGETGDISDSLNGHCFNVGLLQTPSMREPECMILEGTAETIFLDDKADSPSMTVRILTSEAPGAPFIEQVMPFSKFLTLFAGTVEHFTQVIDSPNGGFCDLQAGWPHAKPVTGWLGKTMVMNGLRSDKQFPLQFYNRILYTGWECKPGGVGCMPVQEHAGIVTGCHPYDLNDLQLRGVSADIKPEELELIAQVMEETTPPMVDPSIFKTLSGYWVPCQPLESVNQQCSSKRQAGVEYIRIAVMETPGVPEFIPILLEAKGQAIARANEINSRHPQSDGIKGTVMALTTGVHILLDVPLKNASLTYIDSLKQALKELKWPARVQAVPGGIHHD